MTKYNVHAWNGKGESRVVCVYAESAKLAVLQASLQYPQFQNYVAS